VVCCLLVWFAVSDWCPLEVTAPIFHFCCTFRVMYANVAKRIKRPKRLGTLSVFTIRINQKHKKEIGT